MVKSADDKVGVAVVGLGVGEQHARAYLADARCELLWLVDLDGDKAKRLASTLGARAASSDFDEILEDPEVDSVSIASYDDAHFAQVVAALDAGKHVFVEKPLCRTIEELAKVKKAWWQHRGKMKLSSNLVLRAAPVYQWLKAEVTAGRLGDLYSVDGEYLYGRIHKITEGWRKDVEDYSVIEGGGVHLIDLFVWLTGQRPRTVFAAGNRICTQHTAFRYNDFVTATLRCPSGLIARISANFGCVHRHQHVIRVFGTEGTFLLDDAGPRFHVSRDPSQPASAVNMPALPATKGALVSPFVSAILADEDLNSHTQEMFDVISICTACDTAVKSGEITEVQYV